MFRLAILSARGRLGTFAGALVALFAASVLAMAWGMQLEGVLRASPPVERYAAAPAVVTVAHGWSSAALTPYVLSAGRAPARAGEVVTGYPATLGSRVSLSATGPAHTVTVVGVARPRHAVARQTSIFLTDAEATRLAGHPGRVDAIGVLAAPGFDVTRVRAAVRGARSGAVVLTGAARGDAEYPELRQTRTTLIPVTAAFGGLAMFIALFVVAGTMGLSIHQREREIALMRAVAATPGQIRRMITWEAAFVAVVGSAAGVWPGAVLGQRLGHALVRHGIAPDNVSVHADWMPAAAAVLGGLVTALVAVLAAGRRASRVAPTVALTDAAVEPRLLGPGRLIGGALALAGAIPLFTVSTTTSTPRDRGGDVRADGDLPGGGGRVPRTGRGSSRGSPARAAAGCGRARRRVPRVRQPRHGDASVLIGDHPAGPHRGDELHAAVQHHHDRPRHRPAAPRGPDRPARYHQRRAGVAVPGAGRCARHARGPLGGGADADDSGPEPRRLG